MGLRKEARSLGRRGPRDPRAADPALLRCPGASATGSAAATTVPRAPHDDAARTRRPRGASSPHLAVGLARPVTGGLPLLPPLPSALRPLPPDSTWLPESASCVACVPPCWPLRPVPSDVEREGGGNLARATRGSRYVTRRPAPGEWEAGGHPPAAFPLPSAPSCCGNWKSLGPGGSEEVDQTAAGLHSVFSVVRRD